MSSFESEYKKYAQESTPDLWARIEAGVDAFEKSQGKSQEKPANVVNFEHAKATVQAQNSNENNENETSYTGRKKPKIRKYAGIIAAAACLLIAAPAIVYMTKNPVGGMSAAADAPAAAFAAAESASEEAAMPAAEEYEEAVPDISNSMSEAAEAPAAEAPAAEPAMEEAGESDSAGTSDSLMLPATAEEQNGGAAMEAAAEAMEAEAEEPAVETIDSEAEDDENSLKGTQAKADGKAQDEYPIRADWDTGFGPSEGEVIVLDKNAPQTSIRLFIDKDITDFRIMKITILGYSEEEGTQYDSKDVYDGGKFKAGDELTLRLSFPGDLPQYAISFKDSSGKETVLAISESGMDGSVVLSEL